MSTIAFWSPLTGGSGNSSHAAAVASMFALESSAKLLLGHGGTAGRRIEEAFQSRRVGLDHSIVSYQDSGMDALERLCMNKRLHKDNLRDYTIPMLPERLDLVAGNEKRDGTLPGYRCQLLHSILAIAKQYYDLVVMDAGSGVKEIQGKGDEAILASADLVVVSLTQNIRELEAFFSGDTRPQVLQNKPYILTIGRYDRYSHCTLQNIKRRFGVKDSIHGIPYCTDFLDAWNSQGLLTFMQKSRLLNGNNDSAQFANSIKGLIKQIAEQMNLTVSLKMMERGA